MMMAGFSFGRQSTARQGRRRGFTLPEVLATLVLMGIVLPVVMRGISGAMAAASRAKFTAQATTLGEAKLSELIATSQWSSAAGGGDFGQDWPGFKWECQTTTRDYGATEIVLRVTWNERGADRSILLSTMAYDNTLTMGTSQ